MRANSIVFAVATALVTVAGAASAGERTTDPVQTAHKWWQPDPDSFQFQIQKDNEMLKRQGFDPYSPA